MFDVIVSGGGVAGLCLALQLQQTFPALSVCVVEAAPLPRSPAHLGLGESTSEVAAWYLHDRLGLGAHLQQEHVHKHGLRFLHARAQGTPAHLRAEWASLQPGGGVWSMPYQGIRPATWQLHRGRLEHHLGALVLAGGATVYDQSSVEAIDVGPPHHVRVRGPRGTFTLQARWVVDTAGRSGLLDEALGPLTPTGHQVRASWGWAEGRIDPDRLSEHPDWRARTPPDVRWRSTTHLVGPGRWLWLIPLGSGQTSVGLVRDPRTSAPLPDAHALAAWIAAEEPELAPLLREAGGLHSVRDAVFPARLAPTLLDDRGLARSGDAAAFVDPLYSSGLDLTAFANELIVAAIAAEARGEPLARSARVANAWWRGITEQYSRIYGPIWPVLGKPRVLCAKLLWDHTVYFSSLAAIALAGRAGDLAAIADLRGPFERIARLGDRVQPMFAAWAAADTAPVLGHADTAAFPLFRRQLLALRDAAPHTLPRRLQESVGELEAEALALWARASGAADDRPVNPYALGLDAAVWEAEGLFAGPVRRISAVAQQEARPAFLDGP